MTQPENTEYDFKSKLRKAQDIDQAARAYFERCKINVEEVADLEWDSLPDYVPDNVTRGKSFYRDEVSLTVETLWRAGRLC